MCLVISFSNQHTFFKWYWLTFFFFLTPSDSLVQLSSPWQYTQKSAAGWSARLVHRFTFHFCLCIVHRHCVALQCMCYWGFGIKCRLLQLYSRLYLSQELFVSVWLLVECLVSWCLVSHQDTWCCFCFHICKYYWAYIRRLLEDCVHRQETEVVCELSKHFF